MSTEEECAVTEFTKDFWGLDEPLSPDTDIFSKLCMSGDDCADFIEKFFEKFGIESSGYRWYFHHGEEGYNWGGIFFKPPYRRVNRIFVTPRILEDAIKIKRWPIEYPPYELPPIRWDIRINQILLFVFAALLAVWLISRIAR